MSNGPTPAEKSEPPCGSSARGGDDEVEAVLAGAEDHVVAERRAEILERVGFLEEQERVEVHAPLARAGSGT